MVAVTRSVTTYRATYINRGAEKLYRVFVFGKPTIFLPFTHFKRNTVLALQKFTLKNELILLILA